MQLTVGTTESATPELAVEGQIAVAAPPWWPASLPSPETTAAIVVGMAVLAAVALVLIVRVVVPTGVRVGHVARRVWERITPESTFGTVMVLFSVLVVVVMAPTLFTLVDAKGAMHDVAGGTGAIAEMDGDTVEFSPVTNDGDGGETTLSRPTPDRDGDRLPDEWERAGETPDGVPLPNASAGRKDLYVQVLYGDGIDPLTDAERAELRRIWARMPVQNPDGSTGIDVHIVDERRLDREVRTYEPDADRIRSRYDREHLGGATCVYYQTTFGEITHPDLRSRGALGGYVSWVDGTDTSAHEGRSNRVAFLTHQLLHNTAGRVEGRPHTEHGWLATEYDGTDRELSSATAAELNDGFALGAYEERHICGHD